MLAVNFKQLQGSAGDGNEYEVSLCHVRHNYSHPSIKLNTKSCWMADLENEESMTRFLDVSM